MTICRLFIEFPEEYKFTKCCVQKSFFCFCFNIQSNICTKHVVNLYFSWNSMNNLWCKNEGFWKRFTCTSRNFFGLVRLVLELWFQNVFNKCQKLRFKIFKTFLDLSKLTSPKWFVHVQNILDWSRIVLDPKKAKGKIVLCAFHVIFDTWQSVQIGAELGIFVFF